MGCDNARMRILVVEDDAGIACGLRSNLQQRGYAGDVSDGVASAWSALRAERFDAVLLDLGLVDGDGSELLRRPSGFRDTRLPDRPSGFFRPARPEWTRRIPFRIP